MKFYFKTLLPYFLMLVLNYYVVKYSFIGMTAPYDWSFAAGILALITPVILQNKALDNQHDAIWRWNGQMPATVVNSGDGKSGLLFNIPTNKQ